MMDSFTMHRSYLNAMSFLPKEKHLAFLQMVISYGLDEIEPDAANELMPLFQLIKPNIEESNRKRKYLISSRGKQGSQEERKQEAHTPTHDHAHDHSLRIGIGKGNGIGRGSGIEEEGMEGVPLQEHPKQQPASKRFVKPTVAEVAKYCEERRNGINAQKFVDHYEMVGWVVGKSRTPMKDWRSAVRTWETRDSERREEDGQQAGASTWDQSQRTLRARRPEGAE